MSSHHPNLSQEGEPLPPDQRSFRRQLFIYFTVLIVVEAIGLSLIGTIGFQLAVITVMFSPGLGALAARYLGPGIIWWGRPSWWILAAFVPVVVVFGALLLAAGLGWVDYSSAALRSSLFPLSLSVLLTFAAAFGEELGWRGFFWPLLRGRFAFVASSIILWLVWLTFHLPGTVIGVYGSFSELPAFAVSLLGWVLFVGVITDRSCSLWPAVFLHALWNIYVSPAFVGLVGGEAVQAFTGVGLVGEWGWVTAAASLALGVGASLWHLRAGRGGRIVSRSIDLSS